MNRLHRWFCRSDRWATALQTQILPWVTAGVELGDDLLEIGPGPGRVTDYLRRWSSKVALTSLELDAELARSLDARYRGTNVEVVHGDGTAMLFEDERFSSALCLTMLHHVPSPALQDALLSETFRVLKPGGVLAGCDSRASLPLRVMHWFDTMVLVDPDVLGRRLETVGFTDVDVEKRPYAFRFCARRPIMARGIHGRGEAS